MSIGIREHPTDTFIIHIGVHGCLIVDIHILERNQINNYLRLIGLLEQLTDGIDIGQDVALIDIKQNRNNLLLIVLNRKTVVDVLDVVDVAVVVGLGIILERREEVVGGGGQGLAVGLVVTH